MKWTTEKPTEPGWYWLRRPSISKVKVWETEVVKVNMADMAYFREIDTRNYYFFGPIPEPEDD